MSISKNPPRLLAPIGLLGLHHYVQHSDCDGCWIYGQCADMSQTFELLKPFISAAEKDWFDIELSVIGEAVKTKTYIIFS